MTDDLERNGPKNGPYPTLREMLKERFDALEEKVDARWQAHSDEHAALAREMVDARERMEERLEGMNAFREENRKERALAAAEREKDRAQFLRVETYEAKMEPLSKRLADLEAFKNKGATLGAIGVFLAGAFGFLLSRLFPT